MRLCVVVSPNAAFGNKWLGSTTLPPFQPTHIQVDRLLRRNPDHRYGNELHLFIKDAQAKEDLAVGVGVGVVGVGLIGAAAVVFGALLGGGGRRGSR